MGILCLPQMNRNQLDGGLEPYPTPQSQISVVDLTGTSPIRSGSERSVTPLDMSTGSSLSTAISPVAYRHLGRNSEIRDIGSPPAVLRRSTTYRRFDHFFKDVLISSPRRLYPELNLSSEENQFKEVQIRIGKPSGMRLDADGWSLYRQISTVVVTTSSDALSQTILGLWQSSEKFTFIGEPLVLESQELLGMRPAWMHIQKIQGLNFGAVIRDLRTWLSTSFEVGSIYHTCSDGVIDIRLLLKSKAVRRS